MNLLPNTQTSLSNIQEGYYSFGRIPITSPDQFVPLYLTQYVQGDNKDVNFLLDTPEFGCDDNNLGKTKFVNTYKNLFLTNFTSYQFLLPKYQIPLCRTSYLGDFFFGSNLNKFIQRTSISYSNSCFTSAILFGCFVRITTKTINYFNSKKYNLSNYITKSILPISLIVVKAKHIPKLRLSFYLQLKDKISIPYGDMKLLKLSNCKDVIHLTKLNSISDYVVTEYCSEETMLKYVTNLKPVPNRAEESLNNTRKLVNNQIVEEVV